MPKAFRLAGRLRSSPDESPDVTPDISAELFERAFRNLSDPASIGRFRSDVDRAGRMGMRDGVFAKIGDSNLAAYNALYGLGCREPRLGRHAWLEPTMERYREIPLPPGQGLADQVPSVEARRPWNSFSRASTATHSMINGIHLLEPSARFTARPMGWKIEPGCRPEESILNYEIRLLKPRFVFLNLGTNGASYDLTSGQTAEQVGEVIEEIRRLGPVPVVFTIPPQLDRGEIQGRWKFAREASEAIAEVAEEAGVPVFDQWLVLSDERLVNHGMIEFDQGFFDGFHLETLGGFRAPDSLENSVDFRPASLRYGANLRNLLLLRTLQALDAALEAGDAGRTGNSGAGRDAGLDEDQDQATSGT